MESAFEHIDTLVAKMLAGEASEAEKAEVETWALQSPSNRAFVNDAIQLFKEAQPVSKQINTEAAWLKINQRIESETKVISLSRTKFKNSGSICFDCCSFTNYKIWIKHRK